MAIFHTLESSSRGFKVNLEFFRKIAREATDRGIKIAVENRPEKRLFGSAPEELKLLMEAVDENIWICVDAGHANINRNLSHLLENLSTHVIEIHLHDNNGERDEHKPLFAGTVDWRLVSNWLKNRRTEINLVFEILCSEQRPNA